MKIIYDDGIPVALDWQLQCPLRVNMSLVWAPLLSHATAFVRIKRRLPSGNFVLIDATGKETINSEESIRESCVVDYRGK